MKRVIDIRFRIVILVYLFGALVIFVPLMVIGARRWVTKNRRTPAIAQYIGRNAEIVDTLDWGWAHVLINAQLLLVRAEDEVPLEANQSVRVTGVDGSMLIVQLSAEESVTPE